MGTFFGAYVYVFYPRAIFAANSFCISLETTGFHVASPLDLSVMETIFPHMMHT